MAGQIAQRPFASLARLHDAAWSERVQRLANVLPELARDAAVARREAARLRTENAALKNQVLQLTPGAAGRVAHAGPVSGTS